jgi:hypothetical protein
MSTSTVATHLESVDLCPELVAVLPGHILAGNLSLHLVQPLVQAVQVLARLPKLLLHGLLRGEKGRLDAGCGRS